MCIRGLKLQFLKWSAKYYFLFTIFFIIQLTFWIFPIKKQLFSIGVGLNTVQTILLLTINLLLLILWFKILGWYHLWFRYLAYSISWIIYFLKKIWEKWRVKFILFLFIVILIQYIRYIIIYSKFDPKFFLDLKHILITLFLLLILYILKGLSKARKRFLIMEFKNFTTQKSEELNNAIKGIAPLLLNDLGWVSKLLKDIDEFQPECESKVINPSSLDIQEYSKSLDEFSDALSIVTSNPILRISVEPILNLFSRIMHGPKICGSVHGSGNGLVLKAQLKGGKIDRAWNISCDEIDPPIPTSDEEIIIRMTKILGYKIMAYLGGSGNHRGGKNSPRWEALRQYTEGLVKYRKSLLEKANSKSFLIEAKKHLGLAIRYDRTFYQCFYNLGIVYLKLNNKGSAEASFRKVLSIEPGYHHCYFQLAHINYKQENFSNAQWFCEEAIRLCPTDPFYWNLLAVIKYDRFKLNEINNNKNEAMPYEEYINIPDEVVYDFKVAAMISWKTLCSEIAKNGNRVKEQKIMAKVCLRNHAKINGMKMKNMIKLIFNQALFLAPDNNDLFFELGKYFFRNKKYYKAYKAFERVFEEDEICDTFSFWTFHLCSVSRLLVKPLSKNNSEYIRKIEQGLLHFKQCLSIKLIDSYNKKDKTEEKTTLEIKDKNAIFNKNFNLIKNVLKENLIPIFNENETKPDSLYSKIRELNDLLNDPSIGEEHFFTELIESKNNKNSIDSQNEGNWIKALDNIIKAKNLLKNDPNQSIKLLKDSIKIYKNINSKEIKITKLYLYLAQSYYEIKDYKNTLKYAINNIRLNPYDSETRKLLGKTHIKFKDYKQGIEEFEICINLDSHKRIEIIEDIYQAYSDWGDTKTKWGEKEKKYNEGILFLLKTLKILNDKSCIIDDSEYFGALIKIHSSLMKFYEKLLMPDKAKYNSNILNELSRILPENEEQSIAKKEDMS